MSEQPQHLDDGTLQSYLEGELDREVRAGMEAHLASCARCSAQLEGWRMLLEELEELPDLQPSLEFGNRVLERLPLQEPVAPGLLRRLRGVLAPRRRRSSRHLTPEVIQDLLDGIDGSRAPSQIPAHLATCRRCEQEYAHWERLYLSLDGLDQLRPSRGFARAVMRQVDFGAVQVTTPSLASRLLVAAREILPSTRRAWGVASALVAAPTLSVTALLTLVVLHPLLNFRDLLAFTTWRVTDFAQLAASWMIQQVTDSSLLLQGYGLLQTLLSSPGVTLAGVVGIWITLITAVWILYRNVVAPSSTVSRHG